MAKARALDKRRKSIRNIRKITRTMELIATARFKKALDRASEAEAYTRKIAELAADLSATAANVRHPLLEQREQVKDSVPPGFTGVLAYEPVWAIGTGKTASEADVAAMHAYIRARAGEGVPILYGGSVKPGNAAALLALPDVGGALVGGASLIAADFLAIARAAAPGT